MSLLLDHGHPDAWRYPLWLVMEEAEIVDRRINIQTANHFSLLQKTLLSIPNENVKARFTETVAEELGGTLKDMIDGS